MSTISIFGSHNAAIAIEHEGEILVVELERFLGRKNVGCFAYSVIADPKKVIQNVIAYANDFFSSTLTFEHCIYVEMEMESTVVRDFLKEFINAKYYTRVHHHVAHAAGTFYQSNFQKAFIISFDGGSDDGCFNMYLADRQNGITFVQRIHHNLAFPYMLLGHYLKNIKRESSLLEGNLVYPGKLMGLCGYGDIREHWLPHIEKFYRREPLSNKPNAKTLAHCSAEDVATCREVIKDLGDCIDLPIEEGIDGMAAYDLIATSQQAFENVFFNIVDPFIAQYHNLPLCITGGCALNIILNAKVKDKYKRGVFVAPNSSDCGIALGALLNIQKPQQAMNAMYSGIPLLDRKELCRHKTLRPHLIATPQVVAQCLASGNIIGVARERAEHGPRALGNRSIICNPSIPDIKEYLHSTIKKREKFRPFAPVVRAENVSRYFTFSGESPYMSFLTSVRPEWREKLAAITHIDGSARVQTVTRVQNPWLYELLGESEKHLGHGVLLNTSFNDDGAPILSTVKEAMHLLDTTCLNGVVIEEALFLKPK